jgi:hypothetical protein
MDDLDHLKNLAYQDGYQKYQDGFDRGSNPYNNGDEWDLYQAWLDGYTDAGWDD